MNLHKLIYNSLCVLLIIISGIAYSQEQLRPLSGNVNSLPVTEIKHQTKKTTTLPSLQLPFFDDFSYAYIEPYPSANNWIDSNTYVNTGFAIAPISLGVATFDGLNKNGFPYNMSVAVSYSGVADILTSRPINLKSIPTSTSTPPHIYSPADSIFLSFYYQAEGFGEAPEPNDSLCLDFFKPRQNKWTKVWGRAGYNPSATDTNFYRVRVPIADTAYCDSLFKFRFRNNATISGSIDHWNLDNVQIKEDYAYEDTLANNVVFAYKPSSFLKNYSVIPYNQYDTLELAARFKNYIRNNFKDPEEGNYRYTVTDGVGAPVPTDPLIIFDNPGVKPFFGFGYDTSIASKPIITLKPFAPTFTAPTFYTIKHVITHSLGTNFLTHVQKFSNYYAYDDCTAEQGYYLNTYGAKAALRFALNVPDTLKSVRIYFDPIVDGALVQGSGFRLMVWSSSGGAPGTLLYKDSTMYPTYLSGSYNLLPTYHLTSCLPLGVGSYFIGIQQITNRGLNIGFDRNTNHMNALYYDIGNGWVQSAIPGSLMINPIMGCTDNPLLVGVSELAKNSVIKVYPNPAQNSITVNFPGNQLETSELEITTALGQTVFTKSIISNEQIDIGNLSNGLYFIHLKGNSLNVSSQKLIISR